MRQVIVRGMFRIPVDYGRGELAGESLPHFWAVIHSGTAIANGKVVSHSYITSATVTDVLAGVGKLLKAAIEGGGWSEEIHARNRRGFWLHSTAVVHDPSPS